MSKNRSNSSFFCGITFYPLESNTNMIRIRIIRSFTEDFAQFSTKKAWDLVNEEKVKLS